jgi:hypothetical protein
MTVTEFEARISAEAQELFADGKAVVGLEYRALLDELERAGLMEYEGTQPKQDGGRTVATAYAVYLTKDGEALWHDLLRQRQQAQ